MEVHVWDVDIAFVKPLISGEMAASVQASVCGSGSDRRRSGNRS
jgi:hypothetical protein